MEKLPNKMNLTLTIAWRNIFRHRTKTFVIGSILFLGALIMTVGNGVISGINQGLEKNVVNGFSGQIVLVSEKQIDDAVLLSMTGQTIEPIMNYKDIKEELKALPYLKGFLPGGIGYVWILNEAGQPIDQYILGVDFKQYYQFFNKSVVLQEGEFLTDGDRGVLMAAKIREWIYDFSGIWLKPIDTTLNKDNLSEDAKKEGDSLTVKEELVFMGLSQKNSSLDILCKVKGVFKYQALNGMHLRSSCLSI